MINLSKNGILILTSLNPNNPNTFFLTIENSLFEGIQQNFDNSSEPNQQNFFDVSNIQVEISLDFSSFIGNEIGLKLLILKKS